MRLKIWFLLFAITIVPLLAEAQSELRVLYPENIGFLMERLKSEYEKANSGVKVQLDAVPQLDLATNAGKLQGEILIISDAKLLGEAVQPYLAEHTDFMADEIAILASSAAKHFDQLGERTWYFFLLKPEVNLSLAEPSSPAAIRAPLCWKLSENWVKNMLVYEDMTAKLSNKNTKPGSKSVIERLKSGELDYAFDFLTSAKQHGLKSFRMMKYFNLGDPTLGHTYNVAVIETPFAGEQKKLIRGEPIIYRIGTLKSGRAKEAAAGFYQFVIGPEGKRILKELELQEFAPSSPASTN